MANLPLLLGHRGVRSSRDVAENTQPAFDLALKHGCDGFEFDVRRTGDGCALVCHDPHVNGLNVGDVPAEQLAGLPRLEDVVRRYGSRAFLDIELKVPDLESKVLAALNEHPPERGCVISSFLPAVVMEVRARSSLVSTGIICETEAQLDGWAALPADYVIVHHSLLSPSLLKNIQGAGRKVLAWTVNDRETMLRLASLGIDGIISDETQLLVRTLRGRRGHSVGGQR